MPRKVAPKTASKTPGKKPGVVSGGARATHSSTARRANPAPRATTPIKMTPKPAVKSEAKPVPNADVKPGPKVEARPAPNAEAKPGIPKPASVAPTETPLAVADPDSGASDGAQSDGAQSDGAESDALITLSGAEPKALSGAGAVAAGIVAELQTTQIITLGAQLVDDRPATATQAARVLEEVLAIKPEMLVTIIDRFVTGVLGENARVVQTCAAALPHMARLAPARVARHLQLLTDSFSAASPLGKDGLVRTFAALCSASVAYQKRLEPVLDLALGQADPKTLVRWTEIVLPALKGEPHARARSVVEARVADLPRPIAQKLADFLGIKLRRISP